MALTYMAANILDAYSVVMSKHELFHVQFHFICAMIDVAGLNTAHDHKQVIRMLELYFENLERERKDAKI